MKYFKMISEDGELQALYTYDDNVIMNDPLFVELSEDEHNALLAEIIANNEPTEPIVDYATVEDYEAALEELGV